jgi:hypothetical protein
LPGEGPIERAGGLAELGLEAQDALAELVEAVEVGQGVSALRERIET